MQEEAEITISGAKLTDSESMIVRVRNVLDDFVRRFEAQTLQKKEWTHAAHLRIGGYYVLAHGQAAALDKLRGGVRRLNDSHGVLNSDTSGYHETLTCFWLALIGRYFGEHRNADPDANTAGMIQAPH